MKEKSKGIHRNNYNRCKKIEIKQAKSTSKQSKTGVGAVT
jgi:hypothetical protein